MAVKEDKVTLESSLSSFIVKFRGIFIAVAVIVIVAAAAFAVGVSLHSSAVEKGLNAVDEIEYKLTKDATDLKDADLTARQDAALSSLEAWTGKSGIVGVRANFLAAELYFQKGEWAKAKDAYLAAAKNGSKSYTAPICYFNAAQAMSNLNDFAGAVENYKKAAEFNEFYLRDRAYYNWGRACEKAGDFAAAKEAYSKLNDIHPVVESGSEWSKLAKDRLIALKINGKIDQ